MKGSKYDENQIITILNEVGKGTGVEDICRKYRIGQTTYNKWVLRYGGLGVFDAERITLLEGELSKLKQMYAELAIENDALKDLIKKSQAKSSSNEVD